MICNKNIESPLENTIAQLQLYSSRAATVILGLAHLIWEKNINQISTQISWKWENFNRWFEAYMI